MQRNNPIDAKLCIILLQAAAVIIIIITLCLVKLFDGNLFNELRNWYMDNFEQKTSINEVLDNSGTKTESGIAVLPEDAQDIIEQERVILTGAVNLEQIKKVSNLNIKGKNSLVLPVHGKVTSHFGERLDPFSGEGARHKGVDIASNSGTDILCAADGIVTQVGYEENGYGKFIVVKHSNGFETLYAHCSELVAKKGEKITAGDTIAKVGSTGKSTGSHLHFEIIVKDIPIDPEIFLGDL